MKKITSLVFLVLSLLIITTYFNYVDSLFFEYHTAQLIGYVFYWTVALFVLSVFALVLNNKKYKIWLLSALCFSFISVFMARGVGDGSGGIISPDGQETTFYLIFIYSAISMSYFIKQYINKKRSERMPMIS